MISEKDLQRLKLRAKSIFSKLRKIFPHPKIALKFGNNWELLVAVQLSAQCTDKKVNEVTPALFKKYRKLEDYVCADRKKFESEIYQTGFYRNKAKNILSAAKVGKEKF